MRLLAIAGLVNSALIFLTGLILVIHITLGGHKK